MSPLWRDEIGIYVAPRRIALVRRDRGLKPRITASTELAVPEGTVAESAATFARLAEVLMEPTWRNAQVRVMVADCWARFCLVPAPAARLDQAGRRTHARYMLTGSFGEGVSDWNVELADVPPGRMSLACAMPTSLRPALEAAMSGAQLKLVSLQPQLVVAFNAWRGRLPRDNAWFITLEEGWLAAIHMARGSWDRVHTARLAGDPLLELERLQAFGRLTRSGDANVRMFIEAPSWLRERLQRATEDFEWLERPVMDGEPPHELALLLQASA